jgi:hypothetical protein
VGFYLCSSLAMTASTIVGAPNLLFLGAGASRPYGKMLMAEFIADFRKRIEGGPAIVTSNPLLNAICRKKQDLEFLIEELDALSSREYLGRELLNSSPLGAIGKQEERWSGVSQLSGEATRLLSELKKAVYLHYRSIPDAARTAILEQPLGLIRNERHPPVVFTTNYDPAIEEFCASHRLRSVDGFVHDEQRQEYVWSRAAFDRFLGSPEGHLVLFKLHGPRTGSGSGAELCDRCQCTAPTPTTKPR